MLNVAVPKEQLKNVTETWTLQKPGVKGQNKHFRIFPRISLQDNFKFNCFLALMFTALSEVQVKILWNLFLERQKGVISHTPMPK